MEKDRKEKPWRKICDCVFSTVAEELLPFRVAGRLITYGIREMKPNREEVRQYFEKKGIYLSEEDTFRIEKDFRNMPLCLYMLENPLEQLPKRLLQGGERTMRGRCLQLD